MARTEQPWTGRAVIHVDMDAFFASVEQLDHPEWRGRPVIVGGYPNGRGVVAAASYEARAFGIRSAMPSALAARLCPHAVWAPPRFVRYREVAEAVRQLIWSFTPRVEPVSIDEAFLDVSPTAARPVSPIVTAHTLQASVDALGLSCSIGVASSKTVAKIASDCDKPHGITVVRPGTERAFLAPLPVEALPGVGPRTAERLRGASIHTLGDLAGLDDVTANQLLGSSGATLVARARGVDERRVEPRRDLKSVSHEVTFPADVHDKAEVERAVRTLAAKVARRLRRSGLAGRTVTVKLRYADFSTCTPSRTLSKPTDLESDIARTALDLVQTAWSAGTGLRLVGVGVSGFGTVADQLDLLAQEGGAGALRARALADVVDALRDRFGDAIVRLGSAEPSAQRARDDGGASEAP